MTPLPNNSAEGFCHSSHMDDHLHSACSSGSYGSSLNLFNEGDRLKTFVSCAEPFADKRILAAAGFFFISYANTGDLIKCPFCNLEISRKQWVAGSDPFEVHRRSRPQCPLMKQMKSRTTTDCSPSFSMPNLNSFESIRSPLSAENNRKYSDDDLLEINATTYPTFPAYRNLEDRLRTYEKWPKDFRLKPDALSDAGFFFIGQERKTACYQCGGVINWDGTEKDPYVEHERFFRKCFHVVRHKVCQETDKIAAQLERAVKCIPQRPAPTQTSNLNLELESDRLKTFENWNVPFIDKNDLAEAGFFYTNETDVVKCYKCHKYVRNWDEGDVPAAEHLKHSPECALAPLCREILEKKYGGMESIQSPMVNGFDTCGLYDEPNRQPAKYPAYASVEQRIRSFRNWPQQSRIRPETLWEAGFFYTGIEDKCLCFQCGTGLKSWKEEDDPWTEHAFWYPQCEYLVSKKGSAFVSEADRSRRDTMTLSEEETKEAVEVLQSLFQSVINLPESNNIGNVNANQGCDIIENKGVSSSNRGGIADHMDDDSDDESDEKRKLLCKICFTNNWSKLLYPCGHVACAHCAKNLDKCAFCRKPILDRVTMYVQ